MKFSILRHKIRALKTLDGEINRLIQVMRVMVQQRFSHLITTALLSRVNQALHFQTEQSQIQTVLKEYLVRF